MSKTEKRGDKLATTDRSLAQPDEPLALGRHEAKTNWKSNALDNALEYFSSAPGGTLETLILARMNTVANLKRDIAALISEMAEQLADAKVAEMLLRQKKVPRKHGNSE
jgi:hypothetical protein